MCSGINPGSLAEISDAQSRFGKDATCSVAILLSAWRYPDGPVGVRYVCKSTVCAAGSGPESECRGCRLSSLGHKDRHKTDKRRETYHNT